MALVSSVPQQTAAFEAKPAEKPLSRAARFKKFIEKALTPIKGLALSTNVFKGATGIAACICKLSEPLKTALTVLKVPGIIGNILSTGISAEEVHKTRLLVRDLTAACRGYRQAQDPEAKKNALAIALKKIDDEGVKPIGKISMISGKGLKDLKKRVATLQEHISENAVTDDDALFIEKLVSRVRLSLGISAVQITSRTAAIAAGIINLAPVPVVGQLVSASVLAACAVEELVTWAAKAFFIKENPFDPVSKSPAAALADRISNGFRSLGSRIHTAVFARKRQLPVPVYA